MTFVLLSASELISQSTNRWVYKEEVILHKGRHYSVSYYDSHENM